MSDMPCEPIPDRQDEPASNGAPRPSGPCRTITVDLDGDLDERFRWLARWEKTSQEGLLARIIESHPRRSGQRSRTVQVSGAAADRVAAAAATVGMSEEELIAEAIVPGTCLDVPGKLQPGMRDWAFRHGKARCRRFGWPRSELGQRRKAAD